MGVGIGGNGNKVVWKNGNGNEVLEWEWDGNDSTGIGGNGNNSSHSRTPLLENKRRIPRSSSRLTVCNLFAAFLACYCHKNAWLFKVMCDVWERFCLGLLPRKSIAQL